MNPVCHYILEEEGKISWSRMYKNGSPEVIVEIIPTREMAQVLVSLYESHGVYEIKEAI